MKNKRDSIIFRIGLFGIGSLFLFACTNAQPVTSFTSIDGLGLLSPKPISSRLLETKGYITIGGRCSSIVQRLEVSALLNTGGSSSWYPLNPQELPITGESTPNAEGLTFDQDCADGSFLVYVFRHNLNSWFASGTTAGKDNITTLFVRGILADGTSLANQSLPVEACGENSTQYPGEFFCHALCGAGQWYNRTSHICENVGLGFFSAANDDLRTACPANSFTSGVASTSAADCVTHQYRCLGLACGMTEPANHYGKSLGNYEIISTAGAMNQDLVKKSPGGYKMYTSTKGILFSPK